MDVTNWIALGAALIATLTLGVGVKSSRDTRSTARSNEETVKLARERDDYERTIHQKSQSASFTYDGGKIGTSTETVEFHPVFTNEGPHSAFDVRLSLERDGHAYTMTKGASRRHEISVGQSLESGYNVQRVKLESGQHLLLVHRLRYRDGNGEWEQTFHARYSGNANGRWSAEIEGKSNPLPVND